MRSNILRVTTIVATSILFAGACGESPTETAATTGGAQLRKGNPRIVAVPLRITFSDNTTDRLRSDGSGSYVDGEDGGDFSAIIRDNGNFISQLHYGSTRLHTVDLGGVPDLPPSAPDFYGPPDSTGGTLGYISTSDPSVAGGFLAMTDGETMETGLAKVWPGNDNDPATKSEYNYLLKYGSDCEMNAEENRVQVAAFDLDGDGEVDRWTIEAAGEGILCRFAARGRLVNEEVGRFQAPFGLTLERLP